MTRTADAGSQWGGFTAAGPQQSHPTAAGADVATEVRAAFERYERALRDGDIATLTELFWDDPRTRRFGVADRQQGAVEIAQWRREHPSVPAGRRLRDTVVLPLGDGAAVVTTLFDHPGGGTEGRQSQTWSRFPEGWRIVAAHVSEVPLG
ncbi:AtzH-like domain-containing protein [Pseudonocardia saturnea]